MHFLGMSGMPRRIPDYPDAYYTLNMVSSAGSAVTIISILIFLEIIFELVRLKKIDDVYIENNKEESVYNENNKDGLSRILYNRQIKNLIKYKTYPKEFESKYYNDIMDRLDFLIEFEYQREGEKYIYGHYLYDIKKKEKKLKKSIKPTKFGELALLRLENLKKEIQENINKTKK
jgi:heme/copper-type cytochrome/quinol oxidase subunit 1